MAKTAKGKNSFQVQIKLSLDRIRKLIQRINGRFKNPLILEVTYILHTFPYSQDGREPDSDRKVKQLFTEVTAQDFQDYVSVYNQVAKDKIEILEIKEIQDTIEILPL